MIYRCPNCDSMDFRKKDGKFICVRCDKSYVEDYLVECAKKEEEKLSSLKHLLSDDKVDKDALNDLREEMRAGFDEIKSQNESHHEETMGRFNTLDARLDDIKENLQNGTMSLKELLENADSSSSSDEATFIYKNSLDEILSSIKDIKELTDANKKSVQSLKDRFANLSKSMETLMNDIQSGKTTLSEEVDKVLSNDSVNDIQDLAFGVKNVIDDPEKDKIVKELELALFREKELKAKLDSFKGRITFDEALNRSTNVDELSTCGFMLRNNIEKVLKGKYKVPHDDHGFYVDNEYYLKNFPHGASKNKSRDGKKTELTLDDRLSYTKVSDEKDKKFFGKMWNDFNKCIHGNIKALEDIGFNQLKNRFITDIAFLKKHHLVDEEFK